MFFLGLENTVYLSINHRPRRAILNMTNILSFLFSLLSVSLVHVVPLELRLGRRRRRRVSCSRVVHPRVVAQPELVHAHHGVVAVGQGGVHLVHGHRVHAGHLVLLLPLHAAVLEPDLDLPLREAQSVGDLYPPASRQVPVEVELLLKLEGLVACVGRPLALCLAVLIDSIWKGRGRRDMLIRYRLSTLNINFIYVLYTVM